MSRAPFQVLVLPYGITPDNTIHYALFRRESSTGGYWQGIAGGGENGESPLESAKRETHEEAGIDPSNEFLKLDSFAMVPVANVCGFRWGSDVLVIPEHCFGVKVEEDHLQLSHEHSEYKWLDYGRAMELLHWDSNKCALWELNFRVRRELQGTSESVEDLMQDSPGFEPSLD
ncbi:MAG: NUDIX pyrophosphatase [Candidatus Poribacteria bacterium]|nr:NUDIX pyrophosphatase [Candidatus Poribacteria bacterium]